MPIATFNTPEGIFQITYRLAVGVAAAKAWWLQFRIGTWSGDMGDAGHQWNDGLPSHGRRHGDHTAWSEDGPPEVVKAFDWTPDNMARFKPWLLTQLRAGRYRDVCKFINVDGGQWSGTGIYQKSSTDRHLHWSYLPGAVNSAVNPLADYYLDMIQEDDVTPAEIEQIAQRTATVIMGREVPLLTDSPEDQKTALFGVLMGYTGSRVAGLVGEITVLDGYLAALTSRMEVLADAELQRDTAEATAEAAANAELLAAVREIQMGSGMTQAEFIEALGRVRLSVVEPNSPE